MMTAPIWTRGDAGWVARPFWIWVHGLCVAGGLERSTDRGSTEGNGEVTGSVVMLFDLQLDGEGLIMVVRGCCEPWAVQLPAISINQASCNSQSPATVSLCTLTTNPTEPSRIPITRPASPCRFASAKPHPVPSALARSASPHAVLEPVPSVYLSTSPPNLPSHESASNPLPAHLARVGPEPSQDRLSPCVFPAVLPPSLHRRFPRVASSAAILQSSRCSRRRSLFRRHHSLSNAAAMSSSALPSLHNLLTREE
ncbi:hypothetical protein M0R45_008920 [Rubus argutus]|uniref:Uncharacterized protein n=1 Tax=Rubus argutus TaxID=59490 RepID=A0AAW1Y3F9_RUBAR